MVSMTADQDLKRVFVGLSSGRQRLFLALYALELTILARGCFVDGNLARAQQCNESLHRIVGYLAARLREEAKSADVDFVDALVRGAQEKGWTELLRRALHESSASTML